MRFEPAILWYSLALKAPGWGLLAVALAGRRRGAYRSLQITVTTPVD